jgi:dihydrodipicolinate synthase/N-acetylneuraminate lyase
MFLSLARECPNIVGVKDTTGTSRHIRDVINAVEPVRPDFRVYAVVKEAAKLAGMKISTHVLPPVVPLSDAKRDKAKETPRQLGVID